MPEQDKTQPEHWTELPEGFELTNIPRTEDGSHPRPLCGHAVNLPGYGWSADCTTYATHGYRSPVRNSMSSQLYDDYACEEHLAELSEVIAGQLAELGA